MTSSIDSELMSDPSTSMGMQQAVQQLSLSQKLAFEDLHGAFGDFLYVPNGV